MSWQGSWRFEGVEGLFQVGCRRIPRPGYNSQKVEIEIESGMDSEAERSRE
jgi:hypothetical protein